ncbi:MAG: hypothetical protein AAFV53_19340 [Myxococcota bacterium]
MRAAVELVLPDDTTVELVPGDIIGRLWTATAWIPDPRVSEAHAMVSLRGPVLKLMALRGRFSVGKGPLTELELVAGQEIWLADGLSIQVANVSIPEFALALEGPGLPRQVLAGVASLELAPRPRLRRGHHTGAVSVIWSDGTLWRLWMDGDEREIAAGDQFAVGGQTFSLVAVPLGTVGDATRQAGAVTSPLRIEARHDTVHISRDGEVVLRLVGAQARMVSELVLFGRPAPWHIIAGEVWPAVHNTHTRRRRWDVSLSRLRQRMRAARVRTDLIRADGKGNYELVLHPHDTLIDNA